MRSILGVFWISLLFAFNAFGQKDKVYKGLDEALKVPSDSVYRLDLSKNKLTEVPKEIYQFKNLQELDLSKNKLIDLPSDFSFSDLRVLNLERNKLETFPSCLCNNTTIRNLFMGKNKITHIPECIGNMQDLIVLDIWFNPLEDLPESMVKLRNLRTLDLSGISYNKEQQEKWTKMLHWVKIEFEAACNCNN